MYGFSWWIVMGSSGDMCFEGVSGRLLKLSISAKSILKQRLLLPHCLNGYRICLAYVCMLRHGCKLIQIWWLIYIYIYTIIYILLYIYYYILYIYCYIYIYIYVYYFYTGVEWLFNIIRRICETCLISLALWIKKSPLRWPWSPGALEPSLVRWSCNGNGL